VQAYPANKGTMRLSSTWNLGKGPMGMVSAGEGTHKSAKAPASPRDKDMSAVCHGF
jgi:hypothetical protein